MAYFFSRVVSMTFLWDRGWRYFIPGIEAMNSVALQVNSSPPERHEMTDMALRKETNLGP